MVSGGTDLPAPPPEGPAETAVRAHPSTEETVGWLHSVETGAAVDGPGMRFVYFMSGCLWRCLYCHNPDTWKLHGGRQVTLDEAEAEVRPYAGFLRFSGGVTFSGGEPMMQAGFVGKLARRIKDEMGLHIALDTQGFLHASLSDSWFEPFDMALLDIKHTDPERHLELTGQPLQPTLDFAERLVRMHKKIWVRHVLVPGWTDDPAHLNRLADIAISLGAALERIEILPFHQMGAAKWAALGQPYRLAGHPTPTPEQVAAARAIFAARGLTVT